MILEYITNNYTYPELLKKMLEISNRFSFVLRPNYTITKSEEDILSLFEQYLIFKAEVDSWPGTILYGKKAKIFYYSYSDETYKLLLGICDNLYEWLHPEKPEDLCFYYNDKSIFASISHEQDSYFLLDPVVSTNPKTPEN